MVSFIGQNNNIGFVLLAGVMGKDFGNATSSVMFKDLFLSTLVGFV